MTSALGSRDPGPLVSRPVDGVEVRCPECNTPVLVITPAAGVQVKTRCSDRRCRAWIVVIVAPNDKESDPCDFAPWPFSRLPL